MVTKIGKLQKKALSILEKENCDINKLSKSMNLYPSETERVVFGLERKKLISFNKEAIVITDYERNKDLSTEDKLKQFYNQIKESKVFSNKEDCIYVETPIYFTNIFNNSIQDNESLQFLRKNNKDKFKMFYIGLLENLNYQFSFLKEKITSWSESKINLKIKNNHIRLIENNLVLTLKENECNQIKGECTFLLFKNIIELNNISMCIASKDYSKF